MILSTFIKLPLVIKIFVFPTLFKKSEGDIVIASNCPSVRLSVMLSPPKPLDEIWCVSYSHEWGVQRQTFFWPAPWGPGVGPEGHISFNFNYKVNFKDFLYQTLCVFSQMKDTKHIRRDFHSVALVMPQG